MRTGIVRADFMEELRLGFHHEDWLIFYKPMFLGFLTAYTALFLHPNQSKILMVNDPFQISLSLCNSSSFSCLKVIATSFGFPHALFMSLFRKKIFFLNVHLFLTERQRQSVSGGGAEGEGDTESGMGSRL